MKRKLILVPALAYLVIMSVPAIAWIHSRSDGGEDGGLSLQPAR